MKKSILLVGILVSYSTIIVGMQSKADARYARKIALKKSRHDLTSWKQLPETILGKSDSIHISKKGLAILLTISLLAPQVEAALYQVPAGWHADAQQIINFPEHHGVSRGSALFRQAQQQADFEKSLHRPVELPKPMTQPISGYSSDPNAAYKLCTLFKEKQALDKLPKETRDLCEKKGIK